MNISDIRQIDYAEGMAERVEGLVTGHSGVLHNADSKKLELRVMAYEQFLQSLVVSHATVLDRVRSTGEIQDLPAAG